MKEYYVRFKKGGYTVVLSSSVNDVCNKITEEADAIMPYDEKIRELQNTIKGINGKF